MCAKGTPARARISCHCSHVMLGGGALLAVVIVAEVMTHWMLLLGVAGLVAAGTFAAVRYLMRFTTPVRAGAQPVHHYPARVAASPSPAVPAPAASAVPDFVPAAWPEPIARDAAPRDETITP